MFFICLKYLIFRPGYNARLIIFGDLLQGPCCTFMPFNYNHLTVTAGETEIKIKISNKKYIVLTYAL